MAVVLYKQGQDGQGRPSDIFMRRCVIPAGRKGNPYVFENFIGEELVTADNGQEVYLAGAQNLSSITPTQTWINPEREPDAQGDGTKVVEWVQLEDNLLDKSSDNPYDDARAHRGLIRGDFLAVGYCWIPQTGLLPETHMISTI